MYASTLFIALALAATTLGKSAIIKNNCDFPIWVTAVSSTAGPTTAIASKGTWSEPQIFDPQTGLAIKITTSETASQEGKPVLHFSYTLNQAEKSIYYDLHTIYGYDFAGKRLRVHGGNQTDVPEILFAGEPIPPPFTKAYFGETDLVLELCE